MNRDSAPIDVLFIVGASRSGSTILGRLLGRSADIASVGELERLWPDVGRNAPCGCGENVRACPFWRSVLELAFGALDTMPASVPRTELFVRFGLFIPFLLLPIRLPRSIRPFAELGDAYSRLYGAIQDFAGVRAVVDTSKLTARGAILASMANVRLHTIHLVRDSRGVAYSWRKESTQGRAVRHFPAIWSIGHWLKANLLALVLRFRSADYVSLRYEDFAARPAEAVAQIVSRLGLAVPEMDDHSFELPSDHCVSGNPVRFRTGAMEIVEDDEWKEKMPAGDRLLVTLLTWPLLLRYGYPLALAGGRRRGVRKRRGATEP